MEHHVVYKDAIYLQLQHVNMVLVDSANHVDEKYALIMFRKEKVDGIMIEV
jgi:hypothetical protein